MSDNVLLPALGESVTEGTVTRWLKKVGDTVAVDEPLVEISTDKVDTEIPSPFAGVLEQILVKEDETAQVGAPLAIIGSGSGASAPAAEPIATPVVEVPAPVAAPVIEVPAPVAAPVIAAPPVAPPVVSAPLVTAPPVTPSGSHVSDAGYVTPLVRKLASENGIDLTSLAGTGVGGRIRKDDIIAAATGAIQTIPAQAVAPIVQVSALRGQTEPMSRLRKVLAERAVASMQQSAQLTTVVEVDMTKVAQLRARVQADFTARAGVKLNFMPFFTLAAAEALKAHPKLNASISGENVVYHPTENISFAVDSERGLLTPVIREAGNLNLAQIAQQIADLAARTRSSQLKPDELGGGTFTLTNTGSRGALFDTPVVFLPQVAILGTGIVGKRAVVVSDEMGNDSIAIRSMVYLALSYDHRLVDGADASRFLVDIKSRLENAAFEGNLGI
ncbi:MAG: 2-oxoglutarate dehydrogenase, E2 component, dihydrolipoamide succinyltransferase [Rhodoluna sp.]|nr:2-oxoglutarate dehydrogenase, E2 component, dihydrolipoamide succinyltransferase [Rhodoluna sp.]